MRSMVVVLAALCGLSAGAAAQVDSSTMQATPVDAAAGQAAVKDVLAQYTLNPLAKVVSTGQALPASGQWSYGKTRPELCPKDSLPCLKVMYAVPESQVTCEWTVVPEHDGAPARFLDENADAARYLLRKVGKAELASLVVASPQPSYPAIARAAHVVGPVVVKVLVSDGGAVTTAVVASGPEMLRFNTLDAAKKWTFRPLKVGTRAVSYIGDLAATYVIEKVPNGTMPKGAVQMQP